MPNVDSFSPLYVEMDGEAPAPITWVYRVNDGEPLAVDAEEGSFELSFPDLMTITFDAGGGLRFTNLPFRYTGLVAGQPVSGAGAADIVETVDNLDGCPQILGRSSMLYMSDEAEVPAFSLGACSQLDYPTPLEWEADCPDLDARMGAEIGEASDLLDVHLMGSMASYTNGAALRGDQFEEYPTSPDQWVVTEVMDELTVGDRVFLDVVAVDLLTLVPDLGRPETPDRSDVQVVRMWFARGVGLIRAEGAFRFWGQPVNVDLVDRLR
jgi:hypothetical protein